MTPATLARVAQVICGSPYVGEHLTIVWHAGEPLVLPAGYYREAFAVISKAAPPTLQITHILQTNGTLL